MINTDTLHAPLNGSLTIFRYQGADSDCIEIRLIDELSRVVFIEAQVDLADFAAALTGLSNVPCAFEPQFRYVGMRYEHKQELVHFNGAHEACLFKRDELARAALVPFEVEGWQGRVRDLFNHHNKRGGESYVVLFTRYVNPETGEPVS